MTNTGVEPSGAAGAVRLFDPIETAELLRGWQLHVARRRTIHETAARRLHRASTWLAVPTTILAAVAGTSAFGAARADSASDTLGIIGLVVGLGAAITSHLQSNLNLGARAEAHKLAASSYKVLLRMFERLSPDVGQLPPIGADDALSDVLQDIETRIADVDASAPIVPARVAQREEAKEVVVVTEATRLVGPLR
jgi:hypothetical protein